jgi:hypothetical protein
MSDLDLNLTAITQRLSRANPGYSRITVEAPKEDGAAIRVIIHTTDAELRKTGGRLTLRDPDLPPGARIETVLRFLDHKPGQQRRVRLQRAGDTPNRPH